MYAIEQSDSAQAYVVVGKARSAGVGPSLNDDKLFRALQAVKLAQVANRARVLSASALWLSYAEKGVGLAAAVAEILDWFGVHPCHE